MRTDAPLIKHLFTRYGQGAAGVYNRLPLFLLPTEALDLFRSERDLFGLAPEILPLPFDDFIFDFPFGTGMMQETLSGIPFDPSAPPRGRLWVRVRSLSSCRRDDPAFTMDWQYFEPVLDTPNAILLEGWEEKTDWGGLPPFPDYTIVRIDGDHIWRLDTPMHAYPNPDCQRPRLKGDAWCNLKHCPYPDDPAGLRCCSSELIQSTTTRLVILALLYISEGLGGLVTESAYQPRTPREEKSERLKPWTVERRRTYIIIDPERAGDYGHPSGARPERTGSHSSPVPHARRGHWRRLSEDRRTWVRPSWVGAREWQSDGKTYRLLPPYKS